MELKRGSKLLTHFHYLHHGHIHETFYLTHIDLSSLKCHLGSSNGQTHIDMSSLNVIFVFQNGQTHIDICLLKCHLSRPIWHFPNLIIKCFTLWEVLLILIWIHANVILINQNCLTHIDINHSNVIWVDQNGQTHIDRSSLKCYLSSSKWWNSYRYTFTQMSFGSIKMIESISIWVYSNVIRVSQDG